MPTRKFIERNEESPPHDAVGLVVEYAPATGETRVRFPDGVVVQTFFCVVQNQVDALFLFL